MNHSLNHVLVRRARRASIASAFSTTSTLAAGMGVALLAASPARAENECGPATAGAVTCTAGGNPYSNGITYNPTGAFALTTNPDVAATNTVAVNGTADVQANNNGSIATTANGAAYGLNVSGANVGINNAGTINTAGTADRDPVTNEELTPYPTAVLVNATGSVDFINTGSITTSGDGTHAVDITAGGNVTINSSGSISTTGTSSPSATGLAVTSGGGISGTITNVSTVQYVSDGVVLSAAGPVTLTATNINGGRNALVVQTSAGDIAVTARNVMGSPGFELAGAINLDASAGGVTLDVDGLTSNSDGAVLHAGAGAVSIVAGNITSSSNAITATSDTAATSLVVNKVINGSVQTSAATQNSIVVETGATLSSSQITQTAGNLATFVNRGTVRPPFGAASYSGSATNVVFANNGTYIGQVSLMGATTSATNAGLFILQGGSAFNTTGANTFINNNTILNYDPNPQFVSPPSVATNRITGTFAFQNNGVIDLRNRAAGDRLILGNAATSTSDTTGVATFAGGSGSTLYLDAFQSGSASAIDKITATGAITGSTQVFINRISGAPSLTSGLVFAQGGAGSSPTAFTIASLPSGGGLVRYRLVFNAADNSYALVGSPSDSLARTLKINEGAQQLWYRSADTVSSHFAEIRDARYGGYASGGGRLWGTIYGQTSNRKKGQDVTAFGITDYADIGYQQNTFGGQIGFDAVGQAGSDGFTAGVMGGFQNSTLNFAGSGDRTRFRVANAGLLIGFQSGGAFVNALGQFSYYWARARSDEATFTDRFTGNSYGGQVEFGYRFGVERFFVEPVATIGYVRTNLNELQVSSDFDVDFGIFQGLRGKLGARVGSRFNLGGGAVAVVYGQGNYVHEFKGEDGVAIQNVDVATSLRNRALSDAGEAKIGFSAGSAGGVTGFVEGFGTIGRDYHGGGGRAGVRVKL